MSNDTPSFYSPPTHVCAPVDDLTRGMKDQLFLDTIQSVMAVVAKNLPGTQEGMQEIYTNLQKSISRLGDLQGELTLKGHGEKGSLISQQIQTDEHVVEFNSLLPERAQQAADPEIISKQLQQYMGFNGEDGIQMSWPTPEVFGSLVHDTVPEANLAEAEDGFYVNQSEKGQSFVLKLQVSPNTLFLWSSITGQSIWTYVPLEGSYVLHRSFEYLESQQIRQALSNFFAKADVHSPNHSEVKRALKTLQKLKPELITSTLAELRNDGASLKITPTLTMVCDNEGQFRVESSRGDQQWEDLTPFTQRQYFNAYVRRLKEVTE